MNYSKQEVNCLTKTNINLYQFLITSQLNNYLFGQLILKTTATKYYIYTVKSDILFSFFC